MSGRVEFLSPVSKFNVYALVLQVENLVCIELSYINTKHPDFTEAQIVHRALTEDRDGIKQLRKELQNKQIDEKDNRVGFYSLLNLIFSKSIWA